MTELKSIGGLNGRGREPSVEEKFEAKRLALLSRSGAPENHHRVILGDARHMPGLADFGPVHLVVTSPPYWDLKEYADDRAGAQLGHLGDRESFFGQLAGVWRRCFDALVPGGRMCIVVGDVCRSRRKHGRHVVEPIHAHIQLQCQTIGFDPLAPIIWNKIANMTTEVQGGAGFLGKPYEPNAIVKNDIEFILLFRKPGGYRHPTDDQRVLSLIEKEDQRRWFQQVWNDVPGEIQRGHPAPFPLEVPRRLISMFSFVGDQVLDPFCGTGTTTVAAMELGRHSIGYEIEPTYIEHSRKRMTQLRIGSTVEFIDAQPVARSER